MGKRATARNGGGVKNKSISKFFNVGLLFPVGCLNRYLKKGRYPDRVSVGAPVFSSFVLEYLVAKVLEMAGTVARDNKKNRIILRHVLFSSKNDDELWKLLNEVTIASAGVMPNIWSELLPKKKTENSSKESKVTV